MPPQLDLATLIAILAPLAIVVHWLLDGSKDVTNRNWNGILSRLLAIAFGWLVVYLVSHSSIDWGGGPSDVLRGLAWQDQFLLGLLIAATAGSVIEKGWRSINSSDPAPSSKLIPTSTSPLDTAAAATAAADPNALAE